MKKEQRNLILDNMKNGSEGAALRDWLEENMNKVDTVKDCKTLDEVFGRKYALKLLEDLFAFLKVKEVNDRTPNQYE